VDEINARENASAVLTEKCEMENYIHADAILSALNATVSFGDFADVPDLVANELHVINGGLTPWEELEDEKKAKKVSRAKRRLNNEAIAQMTPELLDSIDTTNDVRSWLQTIKELYE
jgi:hypothetical protein